MLVSDAPSPYSELDALGGRRLELALAEARGPGIVEVDSVSFTRHVPDEALNALAARHALPYLRGVPSPMSLEQPDPLGATGQVDGVAETRQDRRRIRGVGYRWKPASTRPTDVSWLFRKPAKTVEIPIVDPIGVAAVLEAAPFESSAGVAVRVEGSNLRFESEDELPVDQWHEVWKEFYRFAAEVNQAIDASNVRMARALLAWAREYEHDARTLRATLSDRWEARTRELDEARPALARVVAGPLRDWYLKETERIVVDVQPEVTARRGASPLEKLLFEVRLLAAEKLEDDLAGDKSLWSFVEEEIPPGRGYSGEESKRDGIRALFEKRLSGWIKHRVDELTKRLRWHGYASDAVGPYVLRPGRQPNSSDGLKRLRSGRSASGAFAYWPEPNALDEAIGRVCRAIAGLLSVAAEEAEHQRQVRRSEAEVKAATLWKAAMQSGRGSGDETETAAEP